MKNEKIAKSNEPKIILHKLANLDSLSFSVELIRVDNIATSDNRISCKI